MLTKLEDLEIISAKPLGEGAFSEVLKCRSRLDQKTYALKKVDTSRLSREDCDNLRLEIKLHALLRHRHIARFHDSLQIKQFVYILLEYAANGCLFFYIDSHNGLPEHLALRFFYQTALAVKHLHDQNIIHRDIKPENILLDDKFDVKLCDFGWSCHLQDPEEKRSSICGTFEYMSPEIVFDAQHSTKVDIWCLGVLLYELLHGSPPFSGASIDEMKYALNNPKIVIYDHFSQDTKLLFRELLKRDSSQRPDINKVLEHPAIVKNLSRFAEPLSITDFELLMKNYMFNTENGKIHPLPSKFDEIRNHRKSQANRESFASDSSSLSNQSSVYNPGTISLTDESLTITELTGGQSEFSLPRDSMKVSFRPNSDLPTSMTFPQRLEHIKLDLSKKTEAFTLDISRPLVQPAKPLKLAEPPRPRPNFDSSLPPLKINFSKPLAPSESVESKPMNSEESKPMRSEESKPLSSRIPVAPQNQLFLSQTINKLLAESGLGSPGRKPQWPSTREHKAFSVNPVRSTPLGLFSAPPPAFTAKPNPSRINVGDFDTMAIRRLQDAHTAFPTSAFSGRPVLPQSPFDKFDLSKPNLNASSFTSPPQLAPISDSLKRVNSTILFGSHDPSRHNVPEKALFHSPNSKIKDLEFGISSAHVSTHNGMDGRNPNRIRIDLDSSFVPPNTRISIL